MPKKLTIEYVSKTIYDKYSLVLITNTYVNANTPMLWKDKKTGWEFYRSWSDLKNGKISPYNKNRYEYDRYMVANYKGLGYKLAMSKEVWETSFYSGSIIRVLSIVHPKLPGIWYVSRGNFIRSAESHINSTNISYGELLIKSILTNNNIEYKSQYRVTIDSELHIFDFFVPDKNIYIEYDGEQHFKPVKTWGGKHTLVERKDKDKQKENYVSETGGTLCRIDYNKCTQQEVIPILSKLLNETLNKGEIYSKNNDREVAEYYATHTAYDTASRFHINRGLVAKKYKAVFGKTKKSANSSKKVKVTNKLTGEEHIFESLHEAALTTKTSVSAVCNVCKGKRKFSNGYIFSYIT